MEMAGAISQGRGTRDIWMWLELIIILKCTSLGGDLRCWWDVRCMKSYYIRNSRLCQRDTKPMLCKWTRKPVLCKWSPKQILYNMKYLVSFISFKYLFVLFYMCVSVCLCVWLCTTCMTMEVKRGYQSHGTDCEQTFSLGNWTWVFFESSKYS